MRLQGQRILVNIHRTSFLSLRPQLTSSKANYSNCTKPTGRPLLQIQKDNGDVIDTQDEEDLYRYTTKRWLANEAFETAQRYRRFNVRELLDAVRAACSSHDRDQDLGKCTRVMKYREGQYNKAFLLTFDNGSEVVAKLPNPNAGPRRWTTASEVATIDYTRRTLDLPVPRVLSWSCDPSNPVESEYIIMEKVKGTALANIWFEMRVVEKYKIIEQIVNIEAKSCSANFPAHGCLYYTADMPPESCDSEDKPVPVGDDRGEFCIGPIVDGVLWRDERFEMGLSRGPWRTLSDYATSMGQNELTWTQQHAKPRMNFFRSNIDQEMPAEYIALVEKYLSIAPYLAKHGQPDTEENDLLKPTLWHTDLHLNNIFIDPNTNTITGIIDWQSTTIAPLLLQAKIPRMLRHPGYIPHGEFMPERPVSNPDEPISEKEKVQADKMYYTALCQKYYEFMTRERNLRHYAALGHNHEWKVPLVKPITAIAGAWDDREVFRLRGALINIADHWKDLCPDSNNAECPISFTEQERKLHEEEIENRDNMEQMVGQFQEAGILPLDGTVDPEDYEMGKKRSAVQKERLLGMAEDEEERAWLDKVWPYQDRPEEA